MGDQDYITTRMNSLTENYPILRNEQSYHLFIMLCLKYFYFSEPGIAFDPEMILQEYITDGSKDGGVDALFNDPSSENNDMIIVQCKFYKNTTLTEDDIASELTKIQTAINDIDACRVSDYNDKVVSAYRNARSQMADEGTVRIVLFTSFKPADKRSRNKIEKYIHKNFPSLDVEFQFRNDIEDQIELIENGKSLVDYDELKLDAADNHLKYEDSVIVNISAQSLQDLSSRRRNGLLGMNLRYYVRKKDVDTGIENSIRQNPENFWYKNNGIVIICDDYRIDGDILKLWNFSIVNGGQTTNRITHADIDIDFFLHCKVVKAKTDESADGDEQRKKDAFVLKIAEATNSQKKIDTADKKANTPEQNNLRERLATQHVYYVTKRGDKVPARQYPEPYEAATMQAVGKIGLAGIMLLPGSARSNPARMFQSGYYNYIYGKDVNEKVIADLLKLDYYYSLFLKTEIKDKGYDEVTSLPMFRNGKTFQLACISFLCKVNAGVFDYDTISNLTTNQDSMKKELRKMEGLDRLIIHKLDNEKELVYSIFAYIGDEVLGECYYNALERNENDLAASNYLKADSTFFKDVIKRLWTQYKRKKEFKDAFDSIFVK